MKIVETSKPVIQLSMLSYGDAFYYQDILYIKLGINSSLLNKGQQPNAIAVGTWIAAYIEPCIYVHKANVTISF